jgi:cell division protein FtsL
MRVLIDMVLWALALVAVWEKVDVYRTGYAIEQLQAKKKHVQQEQRVLQVELARLTSPERIEREAVTRLGLVRPRSDQVVVLQETPQQAPLASGGKVVRVAQTAQTKTED